MDVFKINDDDDDESLKTFVVVQPDATFLAHQSCGFEISTNDACLHACMHVCMHDCMFVNLIGTYFKSFENDVVSVVAGVPTWEHNYIWGTT